MGVSPFTLDLEGYPTDVAEIAVVCERRTPPMAKPREEPWQRACRGFPLLVQAIAANARSSTDNFTAPPPVNDHQMLQLMQP